MAAGLQALHYSRSRDAVVDLGGHGASFMAYRWDAVGTALDQIAQLFDGIVDAGIIREAGSS